MPANKAPLVLLLYELHEDQVQNLLPWFCDQHAPSRKKDIGKDPVITKT